MLGILPPENSLYNKCSTVLVYGYSFERPLVVNIVDINLEHIKNEGFDPILLHTLTGYVINNTWMHYEQKYTFPNAS
jgi:hypothetical protein